MIYSRQSKFLFYKIAYLFLCCVIRYVTRGALFWYRIPTPSICAVIVRHDMQQTEQNSSPHVDAQHIIMQHIIAITTLSTQIKIKAEKTPQEIRPSSYSTTQSDTHNLIVIHGRSGNY